MSTLSERLREAETIHALYQDLVKKYGMVHVAEVVDLLEGVCLKAGDGRFSDSALLDLVGRILYLGTAIGLEQLAQIAQQWCAGPGAKFSPPAIDPALKEKLDRNLDTLDLSVRTDACLQNADIRDIGELVQKSEGDLLKIKYFTRKMLKEIKARLVSMGLTLDMKVEGWTRPDNRSMIDDA